MPKIPMSVEFSLGIALALLLYLLDKSDKTNALITVCMLIAIATLFVHSALQLPYSSSTAPRALVVWRVSFIVVMVLLVVARFGIWIWPAPSPPAPEPPLAAIQLLPVVNEETATNTDATGAQILFANIGATEKKNIGKLFNLPPIASVSIPERYRSRIEVGGGNKRGSTFLRFEIPELKINEKLYVEVAFLEPQKITSPDAWGKQYGYDGSNVLVRRLFLGKEVKVNRDSEENPRPKNL